eukprot:CAMPEP_0171058512 /NCGR_PEP_ID=MMETSP0766_2-20121228/2539_1 /TAXON_ID=439317 /ORGANISM="Gambierdiscus australes, Strain CAWD 149" /LENGTH=226 /DNA_ID=CAMNT_0011513797 /DNA_START=63 /DNA_END=739 /DNA_ORIENTATION=+
MASARALFSCIASVLCLLVATRALNAFLVPRGSLKSPGEPTAAQVAGASAGASRAEPVGNWGLAVVGLTLGLHAGFACVVHGRAALRAAKETAVAKYKETTADARLFEKVYMDYTSEYLKGPMYWHEDKLQGFVPDYPGTPMFKNGKMTSNVTGNLKTFSSNELAFLSVLFLSIGLYGNIQFLFIDPQWARVDAGENFNVSYIVESLFLPISFFMHIAAYIQKQNG